MPIIEQQLAAVDRVEDLFDVLGVPFDAAVLARHRAHVLRAFAALAAPRANARADAVRRVRFYRLALRCIYRRCARAAPAAPPRLRAIAC